MRRADPRSVFSSACPQLPNRLDYRASHHTTTTQLAEIANKTQPRLLIMYHRGIGRAGARFPTSNIYPRFVAPTKAGRRRQRPRRLRPHIDRQPLPSGGRDVRGRSRARSSARARTAGLERVLVILEGGNANEAAQAGASRDAAGPTSRFAIGVHPHQAHQFADDPGGAADASCATARRDAARRARSARSGSTTTTTISPRDVQQQVLPGAGARWRASWSGRSSSTRARPTTTRWRFCAKRAAGQCGRAALLHRHRRARASAGPRPELLHLAGRHRDVSEGRGAARDGARACRSIGC